MQPAIYQIEIFPISIQFLMTLSSGIEPSTNSKPAPSPSPSSSSPSAPFPTETATYFWPRESKGGLEAAAAVEPSRRYSWRNKPCQQAPAHSAARRMGKILYFDLGWLFHKVCKERKATSNSSSDMPCGAILTYPAGW